MNAADPGVIGELALIFAAAFGAATILPFQSEIVFVGLQLGGTVSVLVLVIVASVGNILGAAVNYILGLWIEHFRHRRWFPFNAAQLARAQTWYARWGVWTLLLSWAPLGDAFTVIAGVLRAPPWLFLLLVTIAKTGRYIVLAWLTAQTTG